MHITWVASALYPVHVSVVICPSVHRYIPQVVKSHSHIDPRMLRTLANSSVGNPEGNGARFSHQPPPALPCTCVGPPPTVSSTLLPSRIIPPDGGVMLARAAHSAAHAIPKTGHEHNTTQFSRSHESRFV